MSDTVTLTIDGREITVPAGTLLIRAAEELGIIVPRFCDHPLLDPVGACRQCIVDVEGQRKPMTACTTAVSDGMVVRTQHTSDVAKEAQEGQLEFLLINHPLDCPMCDKGGECPLQDQSLSYGSNQSRFIDEKRKYLKPVAVSAQVLLDRERCVLCARCTRFSEQISGDPFIELFERGALEQVAIYEDEPYESYFSGNVIQICPVGALTSASYRFKARPFDLRSAPSTCDHCSAGCSLTVQSRRGEIQRQLARTNMPVNEMWNCDKGRFGFHHLHSDLRLREPLVKKSGEHVAVSWVEALSAVGDAVTQAKEAGPRRIAVLAGGRLPDEDAYALSKYARTVLGTDDVDFRTWTAAPGEDAALAALAGRATATYADVEAAPVTLVVGLDAEEEVPILHLRLRKAWRNHTAKLVSVGARAGSLEPYQWRRLATAPGAEAEALAAVGRAVGVASLAQVAADSGYRAGHLDDVVAALKDAAGTAVVLVGERAGGALGAALALADAGLAKVAWVPRRAGARGALDAGLAAGFLPGGRHAADDADRAAVADVWGELPETGRSMTQILEDAAAGRIDVLHLVGIDLLRDAPDPALAERALAKVGTVVAQDLANTATVQAADIVLPAVGTQERSGHYTNWEGRSQRFASSIEPPSLAQQDWEIVVQLAAIQGVDLGFGDLERLRTERDQLGVRTSSRSLPTVAAPEHGADDDPDADGLTVTSYPLLLDRGTMLAGADDLLATARSAYVAVNPHDADALGLTGGGRAQVAGGDAELELPVRIESGVTPGTVFLPANSTPTAGRALGRRVTLTVIDAGDAAAATESEPAPVAEEVDA